MALVLLAWVIPPLAGMAFIVFLDILALGEILRVFSSWQMLLFIAFTIGFAAAYLYRYIQPLRLHLREPSSHSQQRAMQAMRYFPLHYWGLFLLTLLAAPNVVMWLANYQFGISLGTDAWLHIHLVALTVSILIGLPLFFLLLDLFGRSVPGQISGRPHLALRTKVFVIACLIPLLVSTVLVQYYWVRSHYFTLETLVVWVLLLLIVLAGAVLLMRSFSQSLAPLQSLLAQNVEPCQLNLAKLTSQSNDELGILANEYRRLLEHHIRVEGRLRDSEKALNNILFNMQDTYFRTDREGRFIYITPMVEQSLGFPPDEMLGKNFNDFLLAEQAGKSLLQVLEKNNGVVRNHVMPMQHRSGRKAWFSINAHLYSDEQGVTAGIEGNSRDITTLHQTQNELERETQRALVTLQSIGDGVITTDTHGIIDYLNPVAERLLDKRSSEVIGRHYMTVLDLTRDSDGETLHDLVDMILHHDSAAVHADDGVLRHDDGSEFSINISAASMRASNGQIVGVVLVLHDITEVMSMARQLGYQASHDMLTGLLNRREFEKRLDAAIKEARGRDCIHALFYMDLDQFKVVNDTYGHGAGDELLRQLAGRFAAAIREHDILARLGGDEFGILLRDCPMDKAGRIAEQIRQTVRDFRFVWQDRTFEIGVSIGVVPIDSNSGSMIDVLSYADAACYVAKDAGRNRVHLYSSDDKAIARHHREMEWIHRIHDAFEENRFVLYFQPIAPLKDGPGQREHGEILMRIVDKDGKVIAPMQFIPAAERYNLMPIIDRWVVRTTLGKMREAQGPAESPPFHCSINLSGQSLNDEHFMEFVITNIHESDVAGEHICFEITETAAITNLGRARQFIKTLKQMGCYFSLDDFGSGLSSFAYLKGLDVDYLKIDGAFVKDIATDVVDRAMVASICEIGHVMGLKTIAEFVENDAIIAVLKELGVDYAQGYGVARPQPLDNVVARLVAAGPERRK